MLVSGSRYSCDTTSVKITHFKIGSEINRLPLSSYVVPCFFEKNESSFYIYPLENKTVIDPGKDGFLKCYGRKGRNAGNQHFPYPPSHVIYPC